jgi:hypothetical protein
MKKKRHLILIPHFQKFKIKIMQSENSTRPAGGIMKPSGRGQEISQGLTRLSQN